MKNFFLNLSKQILKPFKKSFPRFPEAMIASVVLGVLVIFYNESLWNEINLDDPLYRVINNINITLFLTIPLLIALTLAREKWSHVPSVQLIGYLTVGVAALSIFIFLQTESAFFVELHVFMNLSYAFFGIVVILPYLWNQKDIAIGITLFFTKLFTTSFYASVLYLGVFIIMITSNVLFNLQFELIVYVHVLVLVVTLVFVPTFLDAFPTSDYELTIKKDVHQVWQTVFKVVVAPVIFALTSFIILYVLIGFFGSDTFDAEVYIFATFAIAFVGISTQVFLSKFKNMNRFLSFFVKYFHYLLLIVMIGFYLEQIKRIGVAGLSLNAVVEITLGLWPLTYIFFIIKKDKLAVKRGLIALIGAYLLTASVPGLNAVSVTAFFLNNQFRQTLEVNEMLDDDNQIIHQDMLEAAVYDSLMQSVDQMARLGLSRFPLIPDDYVHPEDFEATFGDRERDPDDLDGESLTYLLNYSIIDLSDLRYESLTYIDSLAELELTPFANSTIAISFIADEENHAYQLTVIREEISETVDLYEDVAQVLQERFEENFKEMSDPEDLLVQITFDTFALDFWVMNLGSSKFETYSSFSMSFYLGLSSRNG